MTVSDLIRRLYLDHEDLLRWLEERGEVSFASVIESSFPKVVLLAAASDLEIRVTQALIDFFAQETRSEFAKAFVHNKAIKRQFHTFFDWPGRSANQFFGLFGARFKVKAREAARDGDFKSAIEAFCEVGDLRNQLVHEGYATFTLEKTAREVYQLYEQGTAFVRLMSSLLNDQPAGCEDSADTGHEKG